MRFYSSSSIKKYKRKKYRTTESGAFPTPKCESDLDMLRMCLKGK